MADETTFSALYDDVVEELKKNKSGEQND